MHYFTRRSPWLSLRCFGLLTVGGLLGCFSWLWQVNISAHTNNDGPTVSHLIHMYVHACVFSRFCPPAVPEAQARGAYA